jgi:hypothetical protein
MLPHFRFCFSYRPQCGLLYLILQTYSGLSIFAKERSWLGPSVFIPGTPLPRAGARITSAHNKLFMHGGLVMQSELHQTITVIK